MGNEVQNTAKTQGTHREARFLIEKNNDSMYKRAAVHSDGRGGVFAELTVEQHTRPG